MGLGNRKDVRNAVEAAHGAAGWAGATGHNRAQVLYYLAENLSARADEFRHRLAGLGGDPISAEREVALAIERTFTYAAWADKYDGLVHHTPFRNVTLAMPEAWGVMGVVCPDEAPLLAFVSLVLPAVAMGNRVVLESLSAIARRRQDARDGTRWNPLQPLLEGRVPDEGDMSHHRTHLGHDTQE